MSPHQHTEQTLLLAQQGGAGVTFHQDPRGEDQHLLGVQDGGDAVLVAGGRDGGDRRRKTERRGEGMKGKESQSSGMR